MSVILLLSMVLIAIGLILMFIGLDKQENFECARIGSIIITIGVFIMMLLVLKVLLIKYSV